jgi:CspA family cold shock protein
VSQTTGKTVGVVRFFNAQKGWGFIQSQAGDDVFVHHTGIIGQEGYRSLNDGDEVSFDIVPGTKGPQAENVTVIK